MTKSIVCLHKLSQEQRERIQAACPGYELIQGNSKHPDLSQLKQAEIIIGWAKGLSEELLAEETPLRWVQTWSAGIDNMPSERLREHGIVLTNASGVHAEPITAVIFAFMLMFTRGMHISIRNQSRRVWEYPGGESELTGKTAVIVGTGGIGAETARIAKAFRMRTIGVRRSGEPLPDYDEMASTGRLHEVLKEADFVINTLPLTDATRHLFGKSAFDAFKEGSVYINVGRGGTTDTGALLDALKSGKLRGAGLDVFEQEPLPEDHPLWEMEQVIITPHNAGSTDRYAERVVDIFTENASAYLSTGKPSRNLVDYDRQY